MILAESGDIASHPLFTEGVLTIEIGRQCGLCRAA